jgi:hypothetical protein
MRQLVCALVGAAAALVAVAGPGAQPGAAPQPGSALQPGSAGAARDPAVEWVTVPSGWRPLAELASDGSGQAGSEVRVEARRAHGDLARGCFALLQRATAPARGFDPRRATQSFIRELERVGFTAGPSGAGAEVPFVGRGVQGRMRATTAPDANDRIAVLSVACFYNDREPDRCRPTCDAMLDSAGGKR